MTTDKWLSTEQAAAQLGIQPQTLRHSLCVKGDYYGIRPIKLPSRLLRWPRAEVERLLRGDDTTRMAA